MAKIVRPNIRNAAAGTAEVSPNIIDVSPGVEETEGASSNVLTAAGQLAAESDHFRNEFDTNVATVRAA